MSFIILFVFVFLKLKGSEQAMDTLNIKRETQIVKPSVVDIPCMGKLLQQTLIVALLRFYKHFKKPFQLYKS